MNAPVLQLHDVTAGYRRSKAHSTAVVSNVDAAVRPGELICLIGPNGAGKSTLLRTIAGMQAALSGHISLMGHNLFRMRADERARHMSVVLTQKMDVGLFTGYEVVALGRQPFTGWIGALTVHDRQVVRNAIAAVGAEHLAQCRLHEMSDGERQKILIARALAQEPDAMILDEPTAFLDLPRRVECMTLLRRLAHDRGCAVLLSTHDLDLALRWADRIWLLPYGGPLQTGLPEELVLNGAFEAAFQSTGVRFDRATGTFLTGRTVTNEYVVVQGHGVSRYWTERALEREGFMVSADQRQGAPIILVENLRNQYKWQFDGRQFDSLEQLVAALKIRTETNLTSAGIW